MCLKLRSLFGTCCNEVFIVLLPLQLTMKEREVFLHSLIRRKTSGSFQMDFDGFAVFCVPTKVRAQIPLEDIPTARSSGTCGRPPSIHAAVFPEFCNCIPTVPLVPPKFLRLELRKKGLSRIFPIPLFLLISPPWLFSFYFEVRYLSFYPRQDILASWI